MQFGILAIGVHMARREFTALPVHHALIARGIASAPLIAATR